MAKKKLIHPRAPRSFLNGKLIVDATRPLSLTVTPADVKGAMVGNPGKCGAARALVRQEGVATAHVYRGCIYVEKADKVERYMTPARLRLETISFDRGADGKYLEREYRLLVPTAGHQLGRERERSPDRGGGHTPSAPAQLRPKYDIEGARPRVVIYRSRERQ